MEPEHSQRGIDRPGLVFAALFLFAAAPVLACDLLPLFDYPNHLARMHLLWALPRSPTLGEFYALHWAPVPNLAMDAVVPPLLNAMPLAWAGKAFVLLTFLLLAGGAALVHRALFGRWSAWPALAFLLLYNRLLLWGFLNYLAGIGLALCGFAAWIAVARAGMARRLALGAVLALGTYLAHLMACGVLALLIGGYEAGLLWRRRAPPAAAAAALATAALPFLLPLGLLLAAPGAAAGGISFAAPWRKLDLLFSVFDDYSRPFDIACFAMALAGLGWAFARRWARLDPRMALPLLLLAAAYLAMPSQLFTASGADRRLPLVLALVLIAGSRWAAPGRRAERLFLAAAGILFLARLGVVAASWHASDRVYAPLLAALDELPQGSRIAVAFPGSAVNAGGTPLVHLPTLAIARREAFVPTLFAYATQQPVMLREPWRDLAERLGPERLWAAYAGAGPPLDAAGRALLERYDYVAFAGARPFALERTDGLAPTFLSPRFQLYRVAATPLDDAAGRR